MNNIVLGAVALVVGAGIVSWHLSRQQGLCYYFAVVLLLRFVEVFPSGFVAV